MNAVPYSFNAALYRPSAPIVVNIDAGSQPSLNQKRYPWVNDGFSGYAANVMNPSKWGVIARPPVAR